MPNNRNFTRKQLAEKASLTDNDLVHINQCRRPHNRLGFEYQVGFVRLLNRFPAQQPLKLVDELVVLTEVKLRIDTDLISQYSDRQQTVSQHQDRIRNYFGLKGLADEQAALNDFIFDESFRHE